MIVTDRPSCDQQDTKTVMLEDVSAKWGMSDGQFAALLMVDGKNDIYIYDI